MKLNNKGFTLIEILAVIVILSLLAGIAIPSVLSSINTSKDASYDIMISNIVTASGSLYEEIRYNGSGLYKYNLDGTHTELIVLANDDSISINLQTLVSNGFLNGSNNDCDDVSCTNQNKKILLMLSLADLIMVKEKYILVNLFKERIYIFYLMLEITV